MDNTADGLRAELERARGKRNRPGYPAEVRARAGTWLARRRQRTGENWTELGKLVGIDRSTAQAWVGLAEAADDSNERVEAGRFLSVCVDSMPRAPTGPGPVLITPAGYRVEGLAGEALIAVLRGLE